MAERVRDVPTGLGGYDLVRRIAVGGMAEVLLARQTVRPGIERLVVIKSILPGLAEQEDLVSMFQSEARIAAQLQHPNIVQIHDVTRLGTRPCIVMEHLIGLDARNLSHRVRARVGPLPIGVVAAIGEGAALGLGYAHRATGVDGEALSVVHRDVSPHNLFVTTDGMVKVLDFGIAKSTQQLQVTTQGTLKGKVAYMSPEQLRGDVLDGRSDLFSLGAVLWELAVGTPLFARATEVESFAAVLEAKIEPPSVHRPGIPAAFDRAVLGALNRERDERPATGEELARALHAVAEATCDGPPAMAVGALVRSVMTDADRPATPVGLPAVPTLRGPAAPVDEQQTIAQRAATMSLISEPPAEPTSVVPDAPAPAAAPAFALGELHLEGIDAPGREEELPTSPRAPGTPDAGRPTPAPPARASAPAPEPGARRSSYPERAESVRPDVRDRFDMDGEDPGALDHAGPSLALAVDLDLERRAMGRPIPDLERRAAAVADFGRPPFLLLTPLYALRVVQRRAALARRIQALGAELPILEAELREAQARIGRAVRDAAKDHRIAGEVAAVDAAGERLASADVPGSAEATERAAGRERLDAEVALEERLADLGKAAVSRVAAAPVTAPLEAQAQKAARKLEDARAERELCLRGRELYDPNAFRSGWVLAFLGVAALATAALVAWFGGAGAI